MRRPHLPSGPLERHLESVVGPYRVLDDRRDTGSRRVLRVRDAAGGRWFAKRVHVVAHLRNEVRARADWGAGLERRMVPLHHVSERWLVVVLPDVAGRPAHRLADFVEAGDFLRRLHGNGPAGAEVPPAWFARRLDFDLARVPVRAGPLPLDDVRRRIEAVADGAVPLPAVPLHGDFRPSNWLRSRGRPLQVIDFAGAHLGPRAWELARMVQGPCWGRPDRLRALLAGYGGPIEEPEVTALTALLPLCALMGLTFGLRNDSPQTVVRSREVLAACVAPASTPTPLTPLLGLLAGGRRSVT